MYNNNKNNLLFFTLIILKKIVLHNHMVMTSIKNKSNIFLNFVCIILFLFFLKILL